MIYGLIGFLAAIAVLVVLLRWFLERLRPRHHRSHTQQSANLVRRTPSVEFDIDGHRAGLLVRQVRVNPEQGGPPKPCTEAHVSVELPGRLVGEVSLIPLQMVENDLTGRGRPFRSPEAIETGDAAFEARFDLFGDEPGAALFDDALRHELLAWVEDPTCSTLSVCVRDQSRAVAPSIRTLLLWNRDPAPTLELRGNFWEWDDDRSRAFVDLATRLSRSAATVLEPC